MHQNRTFASKVDAWLAVVFGATAMVLLAAAGAAVATREPVAILIGVSVLAAAGVLLWSLAVTRYEFAGGQLLVRSSFFRWRLAVADIVKVGESRNPASAPALSLDRIALTLRDGQTLMVSPRDKVGFLAELEARRTVSPSTGSGPA